jgi:hypothetical protein
MKRYRFHWSLHPNKDIAWYNNERRHMSVDAIARELDISYASSASSQVFKEYNPTIHRVNGDYMIDRTAPVYRIWDFGNTSYTLYAQIDKRNCVHLFHERLLTETSEHLSAIDLQIEYAMRDTINLGLKTSRTTQNILIDICDPSGNQRSYRSVSTDIQLLHKHHVYPLHDKILRINSRIRKQNCQRAFQHDLQKLIGGIPSVRLYVGPNYGVPTLVKALEGGYAYKVDRYGQVVQDKVDERHPYEDAIDCLYYLYIESGRLQMFSMSDTSARVTSAEINLAKGQGNYF